MSFHTSSVEDTEGCVVEGVGSTFMEIDSFGSDARSPRSQYQSTQMSSVSTICPFGGKLRQVFDQKCQEESLELGGSMAVFRN